MKPTSMLLVQSKSAFVPLVQPFTSQITRHQIEHISKDPTLLQGWMAWLKSGFHHSDPLPRAEFHEIIASQKDRTRRLAKAVAAMEVEAGGERASVMELETVRDISRVASKLLPPKLDTHQLMEWATPSCADSTESTRNKKQPAVLTARFLFAELMLVLLRLVVTSHVSQTAGAATRGVSTMRLRNKFDFIRTHNAALFGLHVKNGDRYVAIPPQKVLQACHKMVSSDAQESWTFGSAIPLSAVHDFFTKKGYSPKESLREFQVLYPQWQVVPGSGTLEQDEDPRGTERVHKQGKEMRDWILKETLRLGHVDGTVKLGGKKKSKVALTLQTVPKKWRDLLSTRQDVRYEHASVHLISGKRLVVAPSATVLRECHDLMNSEEVTALPPQHQNKKFENFFLTKGYTEFALNKNLYDRYFPTGLWSSTHHFEHLGVGSKQKKELGRDPVTQKRRMLILKLNQEYAEKIDGTNGAYRYPNNSYLAYLMMKKHNINLMMSISIEAKKAGLPKLKPEFQIKPPEGWRSELGWPDPFEQYRLRNKVEQEEKRKVVEAAQVGDAVVSIDDVFAKWAEERRSNKESDSKYKQQPDSNSADFGSDKVTQRRRRWILRLWSEHSSRIGNTVSFFRPSPEYLNHLLKKHYNLRGVQKEEILEDLQALGMQMPKDKSLILKIPRAERLAADANNNASLLLGSAEKLSFQAQQVEQKKTAQVSQDKLMPPGERHRILKKLFEGMSSTVTHGGKPNVVRPTVAELTEMLQHKSSLVTPALVLGDLKALNLTPGKPPKMKTLDTAERRQLIQQVWSTTNLGKKFTLGDDDVLMAHMSQVLVEHEVQVSASVLRKDIVALKLLQKPVLEEETHDDFLYLPSSNVAALWTPEAEIQKEEWSVMPVAPSALANLPIGSQQKKMAQPARTSIDPSNKVDSKLKTLNDKLKEGAGRSSLGKRVTDIDDLVYAKTQEKKLVHQIDDLCSKKNAQATAKRVMGRRVFDFDDLVFEKLARDSDVPNHKQLVTSARCQTSTSKVINLQDVFASAKSDEKPTKVSSAF